MGTDIHGTFQCERKLKKDPTISKWVDVPHLYTFRRDYFLFGVLANVRNGHGFAGVDTGDPVDPISEPRGVRKPSRRIIEIGT